MSLYKKLDISMITKVHVLVHGFTYEAKINIRDPYNISQLYLVFEVFLVKIDLLLRRKKIKIIYHKSFFLKLFMVGYIVQVIVYIKSLLKESKLIKDVAFTPSLNKELFFVRVKFIIIILHLALCNLSSLSS